MLSVVNPLLLTMKLTPLLCQCLLLCLWPDISGSDPSADSSDGCSAAASLTFAHQMTSLTENFSAAQGVLSETASVQSSLATDIVTMSTTLSQLVSVIGNLVTQHGNLAM